VPLKRGEHRAYLAVHDGAAGTSVVSITLDKGARSRAEEDQVVSSLLIQAGHTWLLLLLLITLLVAMPLTSR
jgi:hypothetical protein